MIRTSRIWLLSLVVFALLTSATHAAAVLGDRTPPPMPDATKRTREYIGALRQLEAGDAYAAHRQFRQLLSLPAGRNGLEPIDPTGPKWGNVPAEIATHLAESAITGGLFRQAREFINEYDATFKLTPELVAAKQRIDAVWDTLNKHGKYNKEVRNGFTAATFEKAVVDSQLHLPLWSDLVATWRREAQSARDQASVDKAQQCELDVLAYQAATASTMKERVERRERAVVLADRMLKQDPSNKSAAVFLMEAEIDKARTDEIREMHSVSGKRLRNAITRFSQAFDHNPPAKLQAIAEYGRAIDFLTLTVWENDSNYINDIVEHLERAVELDPEHPTYTAMLEHTKSNRDAIAEAKLKPWRAALARRAADPTPSSPDDPSHPRDHDEREDALTQLMVIAGVALIVVAAADDGGDSPTTSSNAPQRQRCNSCLNGGQYYNGMLHFCPVCGGTGWRD